MPDPFGIERILSDKRVFNICDGTGERILLVFKRAFADSVNAFVRRDLHEHPVGPEAIYHKSLYARYLHFNSF